MNRSVFLFLLLVFSTHQTGFAVDVVLKNGTICSGRDEKPFVGDVVIDGDKIVSVGSFSGEANWVLDCNGLIIAPGFIDLHNHSDRPIVKRETRLTVNYLTQGCTTIVTGNCGAGPVDVAGYYAKIDEHGSGPNVAHLIPQGDLRERVLSSDRREPSADELAEMQRLAKKAMADGAWGMSTGLIYVPSSYAETDELVELAKVVADGNGIYVSHIRSEGSALLKAVQEAIDIGQRAKLPVHISHFKSSGRANWGLVRTAIDLIEKRRAAGQVITADQYPYVASSTSLRASIVPGWAREGGRKKMMERIDAQTDEGKSLRDRIAKSLTSRDEGRAVLIARHKRQPDYSGKSLFEIAEALDSTPFDAALNILRDGGASVVNFSMNEDDVRYVMQRDWVATASDGSARVPSFDKPHPRSYGTFPRRIGHYAIEENVISLQHAIRSATSLPAKILGLKKRGELKRGYFADVVVFDPETFRDTATFAEPHQYATGVRFLFVNGGAAIVNSRVTGAAHGRALRKVTAGG